MYVGFCLHVFMCTTCMVEEVKVLDPSELRVWPFNACPSSE